MEIKIGEAHNSITAMNTEQLLSQPLLERIVARVLLAMDERNAHRERVDQERRIGAGVDDWESGEMG